jgi:uncharacterized protein (DUF427 family)
MKLIVKDSAAATIIASGIIGENALIHEDNWYFQPGSVQMDALIISDRTYNCPYKGICHWIDLKTSRTRAQNVGWVYRDPKPGYEQIKGMIGFYAKGKSGVLTECEPFANREALQTDIEPDEPATAH